MFKRALLLALAVALPSAAQATKCPNELPVLFIAQDKSGTMAESPDPACTTCDSKWTTAKSAVTTLSQQFANRFRFGVQMYPHDTTTFNCTTGTTVTPFPADTDDITYAYANAATGGGTPTAASLLAAKSYLNSLSLTEPAYVLLITDGLPNCNTGLDPATCSPSQPACAGSSGTGSPNCGAKGCLDDDGAEDAAASVRAAGYKVYVVGFDASVATNVNKAVLDRIAAAGGTGSAYTATDSASLSAALNAIAYNAATCCKDVCTSGTAQCTSSGALQRCQVDASSECTNWTLTNCPAQSTCTNGSCVTCTNECTAGAKLCSNDVPLACTLGTNGCTSWVELDACEWGAVCQAGSCVSCSDSCSWGDARCSGTDVEECELDFFNGCTDWALTACASGQTCQGGVCTSCTTTCSAGEKRCNGKTPELCITDEFGCTSWGAQTPCSGFCSGGACDTCGTSCTVGAARCNANNVEMCRQDGNGCTDWSSNGACLEGQYCYAGACVTCQGRCTLGEKQCSASGILECRQEANGCNDWYAVGNCPVGQTCQGGQCVEPCSDACTEGQARCDSSGAPLVCTKAVTGCTVWKAGAACASGTTCHEGACRSQCTGAEIETCPDGYVCTGTTDGRLCLPAVAADAGVSPGALPGIDDPVEEEGGNSNGPHGGEVSGTGCGCAASPAAPMALALFPLALALLRRRRS